MAADIRDILQLPPQQDNSRRISLASLPKEKKQDGGLARELLQLTGGAPPLQLLPKPKYKSRPNFSKKTIVSPWLWKAFRNPARNDDLYLYHWVKASDNDEYYFAKLNKSAEVIEYTPVEYQKHLAGIQYPDTQKWTKEETDYLWELIKTYDLRWPVIHDRYEYSKTQRTLDDLKERYYSLSHHLLSLNPKTPPQTLAQYNFSKPHETKRKQNLELLYTRTPDQIKEEEHLYMELKRREAREEKMKRERDAVWNLLRDNELKNVNNIGSAGTTPTPTDSVLPKQKKTARKGSTLRKTSTTTVSPPPPSAVDDPSSLSQPAVKRPPPGPSLRSTRIPIPKQTLLPRITTLLQSLSPPVPIKPTMPTGPVTSKFIELQHNVQVLLELKKARDRIEGSVNALKVRVEKGEGGEEREREREREKKGGGRKRPSMTPSVKEKESKRQRS